MQSDESKIPSPVQAGRPSYFDADSVQAIRFQSSELYLEPLTIPGTEPSGPEAMLNSLSVLGSDFRGRLHESVAEFSSDLRSDYQNFYSGENAAFALGTLGLGAVLANSNLDQSILEHIQEDVTFGHSDEIAEFVAENRFFGEGYVLLPVYAGTAILGKHVFAEVPEFEAVGEWGDRCVRGILVGAPPLLVSQYLLGGSRPGETAEGSEWQFMGDTNAVSGHAFMGAVPFLTAFRMARNRNAKVACFLGSMLPALSRITENGHYPSQALLGWGLAYMATSSVAGTEKASQPFEIAPYFTSDSAGIGVTMRR